MSQWFLVWRLIMVAFSCQKNVIFRMSPLRLPNPPPLLAPARSQRLGSALVKPNMSVSPQIVRHHKQWKRIPPSGHCVRVTCTRIALQPSPSRLCTYPLFLRVIGWPKLHLFVRLLHLSSYIVRKKILILFLNEFVLQLLPSTIMETSSFLM